MTDAPVLAVRRCAPNPIEPEHSLCGDAPEAVELGMAPEPFEPAGKRSITCRRCCEAIREVKAIRNRLEPQSAWLGDRNHYQTHEHTQSFRRHSRSE